MININVNGTAHQIEADPNMPLLWVIRDIIGLTGTKFGCGVAQCGACVVHLNGEAVRSCVTKVSRAEGQKIVTIEGLSANNNHPAQLAWNQEQVPQCGYCHSGQIMSAAVLLRENNNPSDADIDAAMAGNICRCGTYHLYPKDIHTSADLQIKQRPTKLKSTKKISRVIQASQKPLL
jgi:isoquinoline 1-oxidoreductase alpha subunit